MRKITLLGLLMFAFLVTIGQFSGNMAFPSANNSFLGNIRGTTSSDVDLYTGGGQVNIPICNLSSRELSVPVSLNYTGARGLKLQEYAGCAGLGWQINVGGSISRVVRSYPDEVPNGFIGTGLWGKKLETTSPTQVEGAPPIADGEPDIFYVKTPTFALQFVFDGDGKPVFANNNGLKIIARNFYNTSTYPNSSFEIVDEMGTHYYFGSTDASVEKTTTKLWGTSYVFPTTWYLDKIVAYNSADEIAIDYITSPAMEISRHYQSVFTYPTVAPSCNTLDTTYTTSTVAQPKYVSKISSYSGELNFTYAFDRRDMPGTARITQIVLKSNTISGPTFFQTYGFNYSYFGDPTSNPDLLRLRLDNITLTGLGGFSTPVTFKTFTYNLTNNLPSRRANTFDFWGYHTSFPLPTSDPMQNSSIRIPNLAKAMSNILLSVKDISGATIAYSYELNTYYDVVTLANVEVGGLRIKRISQTLSTGENIYTDYTYLDDAGNSSGQIMSRSYANLSKYWYVSPNVIKIVQTFSENPCQVYDLNGNHVGYSSVKAKNQNGGYLVSKFYNFSDFPDDFIYAASIDPNAISITSSSSRAYKRGLIKNQTVFNSAGAKISEETYNYTSLTGPVTVKSKAVHSFPVGFSFACPSYSEYSSGSEKSTYNYFVENYRLSSVIARNYDQLTPGNYLENTTNFAYATNKYTIKTITSSSSKTPTNYNNIKTIYYADESSIPMMNTTEQAAIDQMVEDNRKSVVIHESTSTNGAVAQIHNIYATNIGGDADKVFLTSTAFYKSSTKVREQFFNYNVTTGNMVSSYITGGQSSSVAYGYNCVYPIVSIANAKSYYPAGQTTVVSEFFYEGFEESADATIGVAHTGDAYYDGSTTAFQVNYTKPDARSYIIQWWSFSTGKWTLNEQTYSGPRTISGIIDDIRIFPSDAMMTTYTFSPLLGKTGEIDPAGRTLTYEFDGLGRQNIVRDNDRNILSKTCYNFAGLVMDCVPATFKNIALNKIFFKNNCPVGQTGSAVTYSVAANAYTSTVSQAAANRQALDIIKSSGQNYANSNGNCTVALTVKNNGINTIIGSADFTNQSTGIVYVIPFGASQNSQTVSIPPGTYSIKANMPPGNTILVEYGTSQQLMTVPVSGPATVITGVVIFSAFNLFAYSPYYYNVAKNGIFTRNNCSAGQFGSQVTYTVPANTYLGGTQAAADAKAQTAVNTNGQAYANANGTCSTPSVTLTNNCCALSTAIIVSFKQGSSTIASMQFPFSQGSSITNTTIPAGTYTVEIMTAGPGTPKKFILNGGASQTGTTATFTSVSIGSSLVTLTVNTP